MAQSIKWRNLLCIFYISPFLTLEMVFLMVKCYILSQMIDSEYNACILSDLRW